MKILMFAVLVVLAGAVKKRNILLIIVDDLRPSLGCYGDTTAFTPHIDALARESVIFENAFAQQALCAPSRNSFLTSRRPDTLLLYDFYSYWRTFAGNFTTLPQFFKENYYITKSIGKVFHPGESSDYNDDEIYSWSEKPFHPKTEKYKEARVCFSKQSPLVPQRDIVCPVHVKEQPRKTLPDIEISKEAIKFLKKAQTSDKPFFLAVGFQKPHIPLKYPSKYKKYYPLETIRLPKNNRKPKGLPDVAWNPWTDLRERDDIKALNLSFPFGRMPDSETKLIIQSYLAAVSYIDELIGLVIKALNDQETIIALIGDHGWSMGEHGEWSKFSNYNIALRVPFILHCPGLGHKRIKGVVELVDLFPTLVELSGFKKLDTCPVCSKSISLCTQGKSLLPLINGESKNEVVDFNEAFSQYPRPGIYPTEKPNSDKPRLKEIQIMGYTIRTQRFRYTQWVRFIKFTPIWNETVGAELYDHLFDPEENINVVDTEKYKYHLKYLIKRLKVENNKYILC